MARKDLPSPNAPNFLLRVREEVHALLGKIGSSTDRALTLRDAIESGVIVPGPGGSLIPGPGAGAAEEPDLTPPPQPGAFTATGAISHFLISQAQPFYTQGHGHSRTVVYGAQWVSGPLPVFADAVELDRFGGTVRAIASNPATTWHLWIKWESVDGVLSATPSGGTNGVAVTTGQDVALLLDALAGQITSTELANSLSTPIGQIPSISGIASEALAKANSNLAAIGTIQTELATLSGTPDYDNAATYELDYIVKYSGGLYRALGTTTGNLPTNTTYWQKIGDYASLGDAVSAHAAQLSDHETRITDAEGDLTAEATARETLATQLRGSYAGTDIAMVSAGLIHSERQARSMADSTEVSARQALSAKLTGVNDPASLTLGTLSSGLIYEERQARATAVQAVAERADDLEATVNNPTTGVAATSNALDVVKLLVNNSTTGVAATATKAALLESSLAAVDNLLRINDTRDDNQPPSWYLTNYPRRSIVEFKNRNVVGAPGTAQYGDLTTTTRWDDLSGGPVTQVFSPGDSLQQYTRYSTSTSAWSAWKNDVVDLANVVGTKADASALTVTNTNVSNLNGVVTALSENYTTFKASVENPTTGLSSKASIAYVDQAEADAVSAAAAYTQTLETRLNRVVNYRIQAKGNSATIGSIGMSDEDGGIVSYWGRSYVLVVLSGATGAISQPPTHYDVFGNGEAADGRGASQLADALNALGSDKVVVIYTWDEPRANRLTGGLEAAMYRCGASRSIFGAPDSVFRFRSAYILVGIPGIGEGAGIERYAGSVDSDASAYCEYSLQLINGRPVSMGGNVLNAALQVEASTRATQTGQLYAQYTVKTDVGGLISGYGLASSANNAAPTSAFGVQAGQFFVAPPTVNQATAPTVDLFRGFVWRNSTTGLVQYWTGSAWSTTPQAYPFVVQLVPTTINGVAVPPGMYAESAFIMNGTITNAKIANLAVDDAKIANLSVSKLTAGSIAVGQFAQSTGYVAGSSGWRINGDGTAEFSGVVVRGTIFASQGAIGGWNIGSNYLQSTTYVLGTSGTRLNSDGTGQIGGLTVLADKIRSTTYSDFLEGFELGGDGVIRAYSNVGQNELNTGATGTGFLLKAGTGFVLRANGDFSTNGRVRSPDGRTYFDPKASGSAPVFLVRDSAFSEKVRIEADGRAVFNDVVLSRPNIVASGTWTRPAGMPAWDISKNEGIWKFATPCVFVPTGYSVSEDVIQQGGPSFVGKALVTGTYMSPSQPGDVVVYRPRVSAVVVFQSDHYVSGSVGAPGGELVLRLDFDLPIAIRSNILAIRYTSINWSLARLT